MLQTDPLTNQNELAINCRKKRVKEEGALWVEKKPVSFQNCRNLKKKSIKYTYISYLYISSILAAKLCLCESFTYSELHQTERAAISH